MAVKKDESCWFATCVNKAQVIVTIKGINRKVCLKHGKAFDTSLEWKERS